VTGISRPRGKIEAVCQNPRCRYYLKENGKDVIRSGKYSTGHQRYYCKHCKTYFMETKGTPLYGKRLPEAEIIQICKLLVEKNGIRSIERITDHHRDTIGRLLEDMAEHAKQMNEHLLESLGLTPFKCQELWSIVKKQKKVERNSSTRSEEGDTWIYTCIKRHTYLFVSFSVGKWTQETCRKLMEDMFDRTELPFPDNKIEIFTDGNDDCTQVLPEYYAETCMNYGQLVKIRENGRVVDKEKRIIYGKIYGKPDTTDIETTRVENFNGILGERIGRLVRKTKCFSKDGRRLECAIQLFQFYGISKQIQKRNFTGNAGRDSESPVELA
jgi:transposase-like protein/IS1 family transposase